MKRALCADGFPKGLCVVSTCPHYDGGNAEKSRSALRCACGVRLVRRDLSKCFKCRQLEAKLTNDGGKGSQLKNGRHTPNG